MLVGMGLLVPRRVVVRVVAALLVAQRAPRRPRGPLWYFALGPAALVITVVTVNADLTVLRRDPARPPSPRASTSRVRPWSTVAGSRPACGASAASTSTGRATSPSRDGPTWLDRDHLRPSTDADLRRRFVPSDGVSLHSLGSPERAAGAAVRSGYEWGGPRLTGRRTTTNEPAGGRGLEPGPPTPAAQPRETRCAARARAGRGSPSAADRGADPVGDLHPAEHPEGAGGLLRLGRSATAVVAALDRGLRRSGAGGVGRRLRILQLRRRVKRQRRS